MISFPKTVITRKKVEDFKDYTSPALGRAKKFG